ncbi:MAG TPA: DUF4266 domain-containing protein [Pseudoduganella sp.]
MKRLLVRLLLASLLALGLSACAMVQPVAPWEKGALARPAMRFDGNRLESAYSAHTYDSKEAAFGSGSVGGGGCGCN